MNLTVNIPITPQMVADIIRDMCKKEGYTVLEMPDIQFDDTVALARRMTAEEKVDNDMDPRTTVERLEDAIRATVKDVIQSPCDRCTGSGPYELGGTISARPKSAPIGNADAVVEDVEPATSAEPFDPDAPFYPKTELKIPMRDLSARNKKLAALRAEQEAADDPYKDSRGPDDFVD